MFEAPKGSIAVMFISLRNGEDDEGYAAASSEMEAAVRSMPGYLGMDSVRDSSGTGITISYWRDEAAIAAWRRHEEHHRVRAKGRLFWYDWYRVVVARVERSYSWEASPDMNGADVEIAP